MGRSFFVFRIIYKESKLEKGKEGTPPPIPPPLRGPPPFDKGGFPSPEKLDYAKKLFIR